MQADVQQYEQTYERNDPRFTAWRALSARIKVDHVVALMGDAEVRTLVDVGCGDGALLQQFSMREFGGELTGYEIADSAVERVRNRNIRAIRRVQAFDGHHLPDSDRSFDLAVLSHVLEHTSDPVALLAEAGRVAREVVFEVPLEATVFSNRKAYRESAGEIGHIQKFSLSDARRMVHAAGLAIVDELLSNRDRSVRLFWAERWRERVRGRALSAASRALAVAPPIYRRLLVQDFTCRCRVDPSS
jgi:ubiquinone/menaquinone biosynthesis C-methylase UbiE